MKVLLIALCLLLWTAPVRADDIIYAAIPCETWQSMGKPCPPHQLPYKAYFPIVAK